MKTKPNPFQLLDKEVTKVVNRDRNEKEGNENMQLTRRGKGYRLVIKSNNKGSVRDTGWIQS